MNKNQTPDLDDVILSYLKAVDSGQSPDPDAWLARHSRFADELRPFFACERRLERVGTIPTSVAMGDTPASDDGAVTVPERPVNAGRFELGAEMGRGGIGTVLRAHDPVLDRPLAVKLLQHRHRRHPQMATRFLAEARIAAGLQHPGVPPVHDVGEATDGRPFIAMKLIEGRTLAELLRERPNVSHDLPRFLKVFEQVAQTVAYAHSRGVLHRDLKPHNVMSGAFGEVQVMDWGLAKSLLKPDAQAKECGGLPSLALQASMGRELKPDAQAKEQSDATRAGTVIGTPAYMAPEQARGEVDRLDARADVFGLGAILCEILTGQPPFATRWPLEQSRDGDLGDTIARLDSSGCDAELIALAKCCLAPDPTYRPVNGQAVAEAMTAYFIGVQDRLRQVELASARDVEARKRRRIVSVLVAMALLSAVAGLGAILAVQSRANADLAAKNEELAQASERERERFSLAMDAIGMFHGEVSQDLLLKEKQFGSLRRKLLTGAADFYTKLESQLQDQDDPTSQAALCQAYGELAGVIQSIGDPADSLAIYQKTLAVKRRLAAAPGADSSVKLNVARTLVPMADSHFYSRDVDSAALIEEAQAIVDQVEREAGVSDASRLVRAQMHTSRASIIMQSGDVAAAAAEYDKSREIYQILCDAHPEDMKFRYELAQVHIQLGVEAASAIQAQFNFRKALNHFEACAAADPSNPAYTGQMAHCHAALAGLIDRADFPDFPLSQVLADADAAIDIASRLTADYPTVSEFQRLLALANGYAAQVYWFEDRPGEARAALETALTSWQRICEASPTAEPWLNKLAMIHRAIADLDRETGQLDAAFAGYRNAIEIGERLVKTNGLDYDRSGLAMTLRRLGLAELAAGHLAEAAAATRQARDLLEPIWAKLTLYRRRRFELAACHATLAGLAGKEGTDVPSADGSSEADKAMELLVTAEFVGSRPNQLILLRDRGFDSLRGREDFQKLIQVPEEISKPRRE